MSLLEEQNKQLADIATRTPALYLCSECGIWRALPLEEFVILTRNSAQLPCLGCGTVMKVVRGNVRLQIRETK